MQCHSNLHVLHVYLTILTQISLPLSEFFVPILNMITWQYLTILNTYLSIKFWVLQKRVIWFAEGFLQLPAKLRDCHSFSLILFNLTLAKHITQIICYWKEFYCLTRQQKKKTGVAHNGHTQWLSLCHLFLCSPITKMTLRSVWKGIGSLPYEL